MVWRLQVPLRSPLQVRLKPVILMKDFYATAAIIGAVVYELTRRAVSTPFAMIIGICVIVILRFCAVGFDWKLPRA